MDRQELLDRTAIFVLDMDGTYYLGEGILPGAREFLDAVLSAGKHYMFFTNNSSRSPEDYVEKLAGMDTHITPDQIMTSGDVMIDYLKAHRPGKKVFLMGTEPLFRSFENAGIPLSDDDPDLVVLGFDKTLTYDRMTAACTYIREGAEFLATHPDINCPVEGGFIPDCGAITAAMSLSTGVTPMITGKPHEETVEAVIGRAEKVMGRRPERSEVTFVGDRLYTDIATGVNNGAMGALVLTGECTVDDVEKSDVKPDAVYESLGEMGMLLAGGSR